MLKRFIFVFFVGITQFSGGLLAEGTSFLDELQMDDFAVEFEEDESLVKEAEKEEEKSYLGNKFSGLMGYLRRGMSKLVTKVLDRHISLKRHLIKVSAIYVEKQIEKFGENEEDIKFLDQLMLLSSTGGRALTDTKDKVSDYLGQVYQEQKVKLFKKHDKKLSLKEDMRLLGSVFRRVFMESIPTNSSNVKAHWKEWKNAYIDFVLIPVAMVYGSRVVYRKLKTPTEPVIPSPEDAKTKTE